MKRRPSAETVVTFVVVAIAALFVFVALHPSKLFLRTTTAGGDMGAHVWAPNYLRNHLFPHGRLTGWSPDWYDGFPALTFYFPLPYVAIALLSYLLPYSVAFKLVSVSGMVMLPVAAWAFGRLMRMRFPGPPLLALATLPYLFDRYWTIYGGNIASTLAGEFAFSISLCLALVFLGVFNRCLETGRHRGAAALLLAATGLCHLLPTLFALVGALLLFALRPSRRRLAAGVTVGIVAGCVAAFWLVPFAVRFPYSNDMGWERTVTFLKNLFPWLNKSADTPAVYTRHLKVVAALAAAGALGGLALRRRTTILITGLGIAAAAAFRFMPQGALWNARMLPFWYLCLYLAAAAGVAEAANAVGVLFGRRTPVLPGEPLEILDSDDTGLRFEDEPAMAMASARRDSAGSDDEGVEAGNSGAALPGAALPGVALPGVVGAATGGPLPPADPSWPGGPGGPAGPPVPAGPSPDQALIDGAGEGWWTPPDGEPVGPSAWGRGGGGSEEEMDAFDDELVPNRLPAILAPLLVLLLVWVFVGQPIGAVPSWFPLRFHGTAGADRNFVIDWANWNYSGYEGKSSYPEYRDVINTMSYVGKTRGCGRAMWEYESEENRFGTPMALMLLPMWTNGCIGSMEGLYFESSATVPYHFLNQAEMSKSGSEAMRGLSYPSLNVADGIAHLRLLGVRYYMAISPEAQAQAKATPGVHLVATTTRSYPVSYTVSGSQQTLQRQWEIYQIDDSDPVAPLSNEPVVVTGASVNSKKGWLKVAVPWYQAPGRWDVLLAASGPATWRRANVNDANPARTPVRPVVVSNIHMTDDRISFDVDQPGSPVLVKTSYFPNWQATGARGPWRVVPNLMVVIPTANHVELHYGFTPVDNAGRLLTVAGLVGAGLMMRADRAGVGGGPAAEDVVGDPVGSGPRPGPGAPEPGPSEPVWPADADDLDRELEALLVGGSQQASGDAGSREALGQ